MSQTNRNKANLAISNNSKPAEKNKRITCPSCSKSQISRFGYSGEGKQRYLCNNTSCKRRTFIADYSYEGCRREVKAKLAKLLQKNLTIREIAKKLSISTNTVIAMKRSI